MSSKREERDDLMTEDDQPEKKLKSTGDDVLDNPALLKARVELLGSELNRFSPEKATAVAVEYLRFMELKAKYDKPNASSDLAPSIIVDQMWHTHLLDTRSYDALETRLLGEGGRIHHNPVLMEQPNYAARLEKTRQRYEETFLSTPPPEFWDNGDAEDKECRPEVNPLPSSGCDSGANGAVTGVVDVTTNTQISIRLVGGRIFKVSAKSSDTLGDLKRKIEEQEGLYAYHQILTSAGRQLDDTHTLTDLKFCLLQLIVIPFASFAPTRTWSAVNGDDFPNSMQIFVKMIDGKTETFACSGGDVTVATLKDAIQVRDAICVKDQRLIFGGKAA